MRVHEPKVNLTQAEHSEIESILKKGTHPARKITRVNILLRLDEMYHWPLGPKYKPTIESIAQRCGVSAGLVYTVSKQYVAGGLEAVITRKKRETPPIPPIVTGEIEARLIALACSAPPEGRARWTLRLLESKAVELGIVEQISDNTIGRMLKKINLSLT